MPTMQLRHAIAAEDKSDRCGVAHRFPNFMKTVDSVGRALALKLAPVDAESRQSVKRERKHRHTVACAHGGRVFKWRQRRRHKTQRLQTQDVTGGDSPPQMTDVYRVEGTAQNAYCGHR